VGVPLQIVSDQGSDLYKGIRLYHQTHTQVQVTYDVTHQRARLLKAELELDETYQTFANRCARTRQQLQQSPLSFLMPPVQRAKARYLNIDSLLKWVNQVLDYQQQQDFSMVDPCHCLDHLALKALTPHLTPDIFAALKSLKNQQFPHRQAFVQALKACLSATDFSEFGALIWHAADLGRRCFEEKLGWLQTYRDALEPFTQMLTLVRTLQHQLKHQGLNLQSKPDFIKQTSALTLSPRSEAFKAKLIDYLERETIALPADQSLLASSDIIESLFGKYKLFSEKSPLKHMGHLLLTLPLLTIKLTPELIKTALETISFADVEDWYRQHFGRSPLAKRRAVFQGITLDAEVA
jgi:hypothetical protein